MSSDIDDSVANRYKLLEALQLDLTTTAQPRPESR